MKKIILHKGKRKDTGETVIGFLAKMWGEYHILMEEDENTAYPVEENSIEPCLQGTGFVEKPWNRWYVNEEMLPRLQDTVLICKGWYNEKVYENTYEALRAYWSNIAGMEPEDICYDHVLQALLLPACEAFLCNRKFCEIFYERIFSQDIVFREFQSHLKHQPETKWRQMDVEYLIDILVNELFKLSKDEFFETRILQEGFCVI